MAEQKTVESEWVGGLVQVPAYATDDGAPYRPEALFWIDADGRVRAAQIAKPGELLSLAAEILRETIVEARREGVRAPTCVRVASESLARTLRAALPALRVVCDTTPEVDELLEQMREQFAQDAVLEQTYLPESAEVAGVGALFTATAALYRAKLWQSALADHAYLFVTIGQLDVNEAVLALTGKPGHSPGIVLLANLKHYAAYCAALAQIARGDRPELPRQLALNFERGAELSPGQRKEIVTHGWEVAGPDAYPWLVILDEDLIARAPNAREIVLAEALSLALTTLVLEHAPALEAAARGEAPLQLELAVTTRQGKLDVVLEAPQASPDILDLLPGSDALARAANTGITSPLNPQPR
jgi:hypothetical protein